MKKKQHDRDILKYLRKTMRIMRLSLFLILISTSMAFSANSYSQSTKLTMDLNNVTVKEVIKAIEDQSEFLFFYQQKHVDVNRKVSLHATNQDVKTILNQVFAGTDIIYVINDRQIVLGVAPRKALVKEIQNIKGNVNPVIEQPQGKEITGKVTDANGGPLPGVNIIEVGTTNGTITDLDGNYTITVSPEGAVLRFSFIGYLTEEIEVGGQTNIDVTLVEDIQALDEVVVIGYGKMKKRDLTGSVSRVSSKDITLIPTPSFDQAIQGKVSGVQVTTASNAPGGGISIRIRGGNSINAGNEPLYVVDGIPIYSDNDQFSPAGTSEAWLHSNPAGNAMANLNPNDIESIEILKDASATAIYGSRGSNGVVIITTKRGKAGRQNVDYSGYFGIQEASTRLPVMDAEGWMSFYQDVQDARENFGRDPGAPITNEMKQHFADTDWQDEIFQLAPVQDHQLSVSGGNEGLRYIAALNYFNQEGAVIGTGFDRYTARLNLDMKINDRLKFGNSFSFTHSIRNVSSMNGNGNAGESIIYNAINMPPIIPVRYDSGILTDNGREWDDALGLNFNPSLPKLTNPVLMAQEVKNDVMTNRLLGNFFAEYKVIPDLTAKVSIGGDFSDATRNLYWPSNIAMGRRYNGLAVVSTTRNINWINTNTLTYVKELGDHSLTLLGGMEIQQNVNERTSGESRDFFTDQFGSHNLEAGAAPQPPLSGISKWSLLSYFMRANYGFKDKYLLTITSRVDGSSRFGKNNKYGLFPSASAAWRISEEPFMEPVEFLDDLKFRISYGITGNTEIGSYRSLSTLDITRYIIGGEPGVALYPIQIANQDLRWEKTNQTNVGLNFTLFDNGITVTADWYKKITKDLLLSKEIPYTTGFASSLQNVGSVENKGIEASINARLVRSINFGWEINGNISRNRNKVIDLGDEADILVGRTAGQISGISSAGILRVGEPVGIFYGNVFDGIWQSEEEIQASGLDPTAEPGEPRYLDTDGDGSFNVTNDRVIIGDPNPDFIFGFSNNFNWKNLDLSIFIQGSQGNDIANYTKARMLYAFLGGRENRFEGVLNSWKPGRATNETTDVPQVGGASRTALDTRLIEDGSYIRVRTVDLGYRIPISRIEWIRSARINFTVTNLFTFTNYSGYDPEVNFGGQENLTRGSDIIGYPTPRTYSLGINVGF